MASSNRSGPFRWQDGRTTRIEGEMAAQRNLVTPDSPKPSDTVSPDSVVFLEGSTKRGEWSCDLSHRKELRLLATPVCVTITLQRLATGSLSFPRRPAAQPSTYEVCTG